MDAVLGRGMEIVFEACVGGKWVGSDSNEQILMHVKTMTTKAFNVYRYV